MSRDKWRKPSHKIESFKVNVVLEGESPTEKSQTERRRIWKNFGKISHKMKGEFVCRIIFDL